ncbi:MAG: hypothetical protein ACYTG0_36415 [Planctomycetota bacterium]|jgi:hypothetical protein
MMTIAHVCRKILILLLLLVAGCESRDQRLVEFARQSAEQQARQNEHIARQSETMTRQSQQLAEAARGLVEQDAEARREMIEAHSQLQHELHRERSTVDQQRAELEQERRRLALQRHRDPILAKSVETGGLLLACIAVLLVCLHLLRRVGGGTDEEALGELLLDELSSPQPRLFGDIQKSPPQLPHEHSCRDLPKDDGTPVEEPS